jgi:hypothetical protein
MLGRKRVCFLRRGRPLLRMNSSAKEGSEIVDCSLKTASLIVVASLEERRARRVGRSVSMIAIACCVQQEEQGDCSEELRC